MHGKRQPTDIVAIAQVTMTSFQAMAFTKRLSYSLRFDPATPRAILLDGSRVQQIISNLIGMRGCARLLCHGLLSPATPTPGSLAPRSRACNLIPAPRTQADGGALSIRRFAANAFKFTAHGGVWVSMGVSRRNGGKADEFLLPLDFELAPALDARTPPTPHSRDVVESMSRHHFQVFRRHDRAAALDARQRVLVQPILEDSDRTHHNTVHDNVWSRATRRLRAVFGSSNVEAPSPTPSPLVTLGGADGDSPSSGCALALTAAAPLPPPPPLLHGELARWSSLG